MWIKRLFPHTTSLLSSEVSVVFKISSWHINNNLYNRPFSHEQFLKKNIHQFYMSYYIRNLTNWDFIYNHLYKNPQSFNSLHSPQNSSWFPFCSELHTLLLSPHLRLHDSFWTKDLVWFSPDIKLYTFRIVFFASFRT